MIDEMVYTFRSFFQNPSARGIGLSIALGAVWLAGYRPPLFKKPWLWAVLVSSAFLTLVALCFIQIPLQTLTGLALIHVAWIFVFWIPIVLLSGLVQEGAKLVPVVVYWWRSGKHIDPKLGLAIGAGAGAGFGILQAWGVFASLGALPSYASGFFNFAALFGFWHIFFTVAAQTAFSALAGYGLAKGRGWQFYLIASSLHGLLDYGRVSGLFPILHLPVWDIVHNWPQYSFEVILYTAVLTALVTAWALWLRWRKRPATAEPVISSM
jgi:RsiW-degrading membrane proteinase PrsW (M82 family)